METVPAYTWLCQFVQALPAIGLVTFHQKAQIIRHLLQKTGSNASRDFIEWKWMRCVIWKTLIRMMCRNHQYHRLTGDCFLPVRLLYRLPLFLPVLNLPRRKPPRAFPSIKQPPTGRTVSPYLAEANKKDAPVVISIHEWWGLNDDIKTMAEDIRARGFHRIAIDLFNGSVATNRDEAKTQTNTVKATKPNTTIAT
jgi:hypothetical protein